MFSVILNLYDPTRWQRQMTYACLIAIRRFTDMPYELIVVDNEPITDIMKDDPYDKIKIDKLIVNEKNQTVYKSYNQGSEIASDDSNCLIFMHNDVFVVERTLNRLNDFIQNGYDVAHPIPVALTREEVLGTYEGKGEVGWRDTGCMAINKEAFLRIGRWDQRYHMQGEREMYDRINEAGLKEIVRTDALITHMCAINNYSKDEKLYQKEMKEDNERLNK